MKLSVSTSFYVIIDGGIMCYWKYLIKFILILSLSNCKWSTCNIPWFYATVTAETLLIIGGLHDTVSHAIK